MGNISVSDIRLYAYHGCLEEEALIGSDYRVDVEIKANLNTAKASDDLKDTVDYVHIHKIVKEEMQIRSRLLEHVAQRIIKRVLSELQMVSEVSVSVSKLNPPIGGDVGAVTIVLTEKRI
ncbi:MAG: dihydroneopterin aldolase [Eudoraea sp.]|nr:dihydroneopterin aldolase [Eudoraea sp.]